MRPRRSRASTPVTTDDLMEDDGTAVEEEPFHAHRHSYHGDASATEVYYEEPRASLREPRQSKPRRQQHPLLDLFVCGFMIMSVEIKEVKIGLEKFGEVLLRFWSLRGHKSFKMMKISVVAGENRDQMVNVKWRRHRRQPSVGISKTWAGYDKSMPSTACNLRR
ncbi:hypothetical protein DY000_02047502 [Brassica cretica]|uniref:Uncharacterized protein n=1 Tax=Brassica cretica TaxID=69181 RepID=A0ABQ7EXA3_BRACR|nr:hypothetical protein DY000_02047502 [Brassica cretica]